MTGRLANRTSVKKWVTVISPQAQCMWDMHVGKVVDCAKLPN